MLDKDGALCGCAGYRRRKKRDQGYGKTRKICLAAGFLLISAGCAIGIGNVWRFPYITGQYGGAAFVLIYLFFLVVLGLPIMAMEFAVGRASRKSCAVSFRVLEPAAPNGIGTPGWAWRATIC